MTTTAGEQKVRALLPTPTRAFPPVTARILRRTLAAYAVLWLAGALPGVLRMGEAWTAAGLGLAFPGGGFLYGGHPVFAALAVLGLLVSALVWWAMGPTVLPPIAWIASAALSAVSVDGTYEAGRVAALVTGPALIAGLFLAHRIRHARQVRAGAELNERLRDVEFVVTGPPGLDARLPVAEHTPQDLAHLRYALDLALQPLDSFAGFTKIDQFREAATRSPTARTSCSPGSTA